MDTYNLINSKTISEYCRKIKHQFNTEEIAVLIYRNKRLSIDEKISLYEELIRDYPDMEVIKRINCKHYDSVKDMTKVEIMRLKLLLEKLKYDEKDVVYTYIPYYISIEEYRHNDLENVCRYYDEVYSKVENEITEDEDISKFIIIRKSLISNRDEITAEYVVCKNEIKIVNIIDKVNNFLDIDNICLNIPTPFKKGDLLISYSNTPFKDGTIMNDKGFPFVLEYLITWDDNFKKALDKGNYDSSDMQGPGYLISEAGNLYRGHVFEYDSWEYYDENIHGKLKGMDRLLYDVSSLIQDKICIDLFLNAYDVMKYEKSKNNMVFYTNEELKLVGLEDLVEEQ